MLPVEWKLVAGWCVKETHGWLSDRNRKYVYSVAEWKNCCSESIAVIVTLVYSAFLPVTGVFGNWALYSLRFRIGNEADLVQSAGLRGRHQLRYLFILRGALDA